jgi:Ca-activated chloride channel family protein
MKIKITVGKKKVREHQGADAWVLVRLLAPAQAADARRPPLAIVPVVDVSGSMHGQKLDAVKHALSRLVDHLVPADYVGLVSFSDEARVVLPVTEVSHNSRQQLHAAVQRLASEASTNLAGGIIEGCRALRSVTLPANLRARLVLLTDGQANCGVATSGPDLRALVQRVVVEGEGAMPNGAARESGPLSLSAFGFGTDCDHSVLGALAEEGGGSFAFIANGDGVLTAFARELGGLVATYASDVRIRLVPRAGAPVEERAGDVLYQAEFPWCVPIAVPQHAVGSDVEIGHVEVTYRDALGREQSLRTPVLVDYVEAGEEDQVLDPAVQRARDERLLSQAQTAAETHARQGDYAAAQRALVTCVAQLATPELASFAREHLIPSYEHRAAYDDAAPLRASADIALKKRRLLQAEHAVAQRLAPLPASEAELAMEESFRKPKP